MTKVQTRDYIRKPFTVQAVQVTKDNFNDVAEWCGGRIMPVTDVKDSRHAFIKVAVLKPMNEKQTQAFVGDWVLCQAGTFKVYTNRAFETAFEIASSVKTAQYALEDGTPVGFEIA